MNSRNLKVAGAVVLSCLVMIIIVIYTLKLTPTPNQSHQSQERLEERLQHIEQRIAKESAHLKLANEALSKVGKASRNTLQFTRGEIVDPKSLIETNREAIGTLSEATETIQRHSLELKGLNEEKVSLKSIIDANIKANAKLIVALTRVHGDMKGLTEKIQRLNKEKAPLHLPEATVHMLLNAAMELMENNVSARHALSKARIAHHECQRARIGAGRW